MIVKICYSARSARGDETKTKMKKKKLDEMRNLKNNNKNNKAAQHEI